MLKLEGENGLFSHPSDAHVGGQRVLWRLDFSRVFCYMLRTSCFVHPSINSQNDVLERRNIGTGCLPVTKS